MLREPAVLEEELEDENWQERLVLVWREDGGVTLSREHRQLGGLWRRWEDEGIVLSSAALVALRAVLLAAT